MKFILSLWHRVVMSDQLGRQVFGCAGTAKPELSLKVSTEHDVYVAVLELLGFCISMFRCFITGI